MPTPTPKDGKGGIKNAQHAATDRPGSPMPPPTGGLQHAAPSGVIPAAAVGVSGRAGAQPIALQLPSGLNAAARGIMSAALAGLSFPGGSSTAPRGIRPTAAAASAGHPTPSGPRPAASGANTAAQHLPTSTVSTAAAAGVTFQNTPVQQQPSLSPRGVPSPAGRALQKGSSGLHSQPSMSSQEHRHAQLPVAAPLTRRKSAMAEPPSRTGSSAAAIHSSMEAHASGLGRRPSNAIPPSTAQRTGSGSITAAAGKPHSANAPSRQGSGEAKASDLRITGDTAPASIASEAPGLLSIQESAGEQQMAADAVPASDASDVQVDIGAEPITGIGAVSGAQAFGQDAAQSEDPNLTDGGSAQVHSLGLQQEALQATTSLSMADLLGSDPVSHDTATSQAARDDASMWRPLLSLCEAQGGSPAETAITADAHSGVDDSVANSLALEPASSLSIARLLSQDDDFAANAAAHVNADALPAPHAPAGHDAAAASDGQAALQPDASLNLATLLDQDDAQAATAPEPGGTDASPDAPMSDGNPVSPAGQAALEPSASLSIANLLEDGVNDDAQDATALKHGGMDAPSAAPTSSSIPVSPGGQAALEPSPSLSITNLLEDGDHEAAVEISGEKPHCCFEHNACQMTSSNCLGCKIILMSDLAVLSEGVATGGIHQLRTFEPVLLKAQ